MDEPRDDDWGAHAPTYDRLYAPLTGHVGRTMVTMTEARLPEHAQVLDIATGSGALVRPAIERAARRRRTGGRDFVIGSDFSPGMVEVARHNVATLDAAAFRLEVQDGQALSYEDASFDAAYSCFGIFLFEDRAAGWREAARVVKPGGLFATSTWMPPERNEMFRVQFGPAIAALPPRLQPESGGPPPGWMVVADPTALQAEVEAAGFEDVEVVPFTTQFAIPNVAAAWHAMLDNPGAGVLLRQCDAHELQAVKEAYLGHLGARVSGPDRPLLLEAACNILTARRG
ncbi:MAG: methyltransferase domain-containing protein [Myxococcota bacterium]